MKIYNRRARYDYQILETIEVGISLTGAEVKAIRAGRADINRAYARIIGGEAFLINSIIGTEDKSDESRRTRKLLLHKEQIVSLESKLKAKKLTLVPIKLYNKRSLRPGGQKGSLFKLELGLGRSKRKFEKKEAIKRRDIERETEREFRNKE